MVEHELTEEEIRKKFIDEVEEAIYYWNEIPDQDNLKGTFGRLRGLAFSILVMIDGEHGTLPQFILAAKPHPSDKSYAISHGTDYYPENTNRRIKGNISGCLHDEFSRRFKK